MSYGGAVNSYMREEGKEKEKKRVRRRDSAVGPPPPPPPPAAKVVRTTAHSDFIVGFAVSFPALCGFASARIFIPLAEAERERRKGGPLKIAAIARSLDRRQSINQYLMMKMAAALMTMPPRSIDAGHALPNILQYVVPPFSKQKKRQKR